jgi:Phage stabilisation protein
MARINIFGLGQLSKSPFITSKQMTNVYAEARPAEGEKSRLVAYGTPGLTLFVDFGDTPCRGGIEFESLNVIFIVHRGVLWEVNNAGLTTNRGSLLTTTGRVSMAHNGIQVMITDGTYGYTYTPATTTLAKITAVGFPPNPVTCCFLAGYFVASFANSSRYYWSAIYNGTLWDALDFANAETSPDPIVAVYASGGQLILLGPKTTEFYGLSGVADQPFSPLGGTANEWGLAATWSIAKYDNSFACLIKNRMGEVMIAKMSGYLPQKISTVDIDSIINSYDNTADATAYSYMLGGHPMFVINFPGAGKTWLYDGATKFWSKLKSFGLSRHRAEFAVSLINSTIVADYSSGKLYRIESSALTDNGDSIEREIIGETIASPDESTFSIDCLRVDMETGIGTTSGQGVNPQVSLSVSRDNGKTWSPDVWKTAGAIGSYNTRVEWRRLGSPRYFTPRIRFTDPCPFVMVSASVNPPD